MQGVIQAVKYKKILLFTFSLLFAAVVVTALSEPLLIKAVLAKYKSTDQFLDLPKNSLIKYEPGAEAYAERVAQIADENQQAVESILNASFKQPINILICATQESFNQYVYISKNARGAMFWGKVFLSPRAFERGYLEDLLKHELTHYLFYTNLGDKTHIKNIPLWFREGIAVFVANGGGAYTRNNSVRFRMTPREKAAFLSHRTDGWFLSANPFDAVTEQGTANWLYYRVGAMFIHYLHDSDPTAFNALIQSLIAGKPFESALQDSFQQPLESLLNIFYAYLDKPE